MGPHVLVVGALLFPLFFPLAEAQVDIPPPDFFVVTIRNPIRSSTSSGTPQITFDAYLNFTRSPADNGIPPYFVCWWFKDRNGGTLVKACSAGASTTTNISGRQGPTFFWRSVRFTVSGSGLSDFQFAGFNVSLAHPSGRGAPSCMVFVYVWVDGSSGQCSAPGKAPPETLIRAPTVLNVTVEQPLTISTGRTWINWSHSPDDPLASTTGDFRYLLRWLFSSRDGSQRAITTFQNSSRLTGVGGIRSSFITYSGTGSPFFLSVDVTPIDDKTGLVGTRSCLTTVDVLVVGIRSACGFAQSDLSPGAARGGSSSILPPSPRFPLLPSIDSLGATFGVPAYVAGIFLGLGLVALMVAVGAFFRSPIASIVGGSVGFVASISLGLFPVWIAVVAVFLFSLIIALNVYRGVGGNV